MNRMIKLINLSKELFSLGLKKSCFRIGYEVLNRSGARRYLQPVKSCRNVPRTAYLGEKAVDIQQFRRGKRPFFIPPAKELAAGIERIPQLSRENILREAGRAERGLIKCFSYWYADYGSPVNWHLNPVRGVSWPSNVHWSKVMTYEKQCGDCKLTWEINRFPHLYTWARAYACTGDSRWLKDWTAQLQTWERDNPYRSGLNWHSGQELAVRGLSWIAGLYLFIEDESFQEEDFNRLLRLLYLHGEHVYTNINYARLAVHNNHLIGEALLLYLLGALFPWMRGADKWKRKGRKLLEKDCLRQFYSDGGYCQASHNYHRLALHYYLWACRSGECLGEPFDEEVYRVLHRSLNYLLSMLNKQDGRLPNWGCNDGALLCPWTSCDYSDFRPVLNALSYLTTARRCFNDGPWNEELLWFWGINALMKPVGEYRYQNIACFPVSGLYCIRQGPGDFAVLRCGSLRDRFGQADQLHLDLWWRGLNVARDGGSYLYNDEMSYHHYFMGTSSHNTITVDGQNQMLLIRRFKWLELVKAGRVVIKNTANQLEVAGEHYGYCRLPGKVVHRRRVVLTDGIFVIIDYLTQTGAARHSYAIHWLLGPWPCTMVKHRHWWRVDQTTPSGSYTLNIIILDQNFKPRAGSNCSITIGAEEPAPRGWESRYYGRRQAIASVKAGCSTNKDICVISVFSPSEANAPAVVII